MRIYEMELNSYHKPPICYYFHILDNTTFMHKARDLWVSHECVALHVINQRRDNIPDFLGLFFFSKLLAVE